MVFFLKNIVKAVRFVRAVNLVEKYVDLKLYLLKEIDVEIKTESSIVSQFD